ncbi:crossover junction endodeoxyribonuclease RuvC [Sporolituus thermophilus]|uniref:Crossover junction endodeoxyribonuclease RuvC n=1 Tax=Sporolituus thermophilus DSM 23256 TaxID=1123285 RepID=A0A1G7IFG5_9FIRM|nr:crossover junction endodeoxyribonuclease RuvC [Sporolituus thermophilus]SDF11383.1 Holliday junction endonuclease RuvC [Sporolituus thermophilus DSM 23256]
MLALGIDPGTAICGYGFVELRGSTLRAVDWGAVETSSKLSATERLKIIFQDLDRLIKQRRPDIVGVEQLFFNKNVTTAMTVGQARGVVLLAAALNNIKVVECTPLQVKQSVVGYGRATKEQVMYMTQRLLNLSGKPQPDDAADALAVAICSLHAAGADRMAVPDR